MESNNDDHLFDSVSHLAPVQRNQAWVHFPSSDVKILFLHKMEFVVVDQEEDKTAKNLETNQESSTTTASISRLLLNFLDLSYVLIFEVFIFTQFGICCC